MSVRHVARLSLAAAAALPAALPAQSPAPVPLPQPSPAAISTPTPFPSPIFTPVPLPTVTPPPIVPAAVPTPTPTRAAVSPSAARPTLAPQGKPRPTPTVTADQTPRVRPSSTPTAPAVPMSGRLPAPIASATPVRSSPASENAVVPRSLPTAAPAPWWPWLVGAGGLVLVGAAWAALRRRATRPRETETIAAPVPLAAALQRLPAAGVPENAPISASAVWLTVKPLRAGLNLISATVEVEVTVANTGPLPLADVRLALALLSSHADQEDDLAAFYGHANLRPAVPPFALAPGEARTERTFAALPHHAIRPIEVGGRPILVPLLALAVRFRAGEAERRVMQAFAVGVERAGAAKLQPFRLDVPGRQYDTLGARPHGAAVTG